MKAFKKDSYRGLRTCLVATLLITSCSKGLLDENLHSQIGTGNVSGPEGARLLTNGIYAGVQFYSYFGGNNWLLTVGANTDEFFCNWGGTPAAGWGGQQNFLNMDAGHAMASTIWDELYGIVALANEVIRLYNEDTDGAVVQSVSEARFWRAYTYAKLYAVFGPVPLVTGDEDLSSGLPKSTREELELFTENELKAVEEQLPANYGAADYGRPTRWAVKAFLARFFLNKADWQQAHDYAMQVVDPSAGFALMPTYESVFTDNNSETILPVVHIAEANKGNKYVALSLEAAMVNAFGISGVSASNGYGMAVPFYRTFAENDRRVAPFDPETQQGIAVAGIIRQADGTPVYGTQANPMTVEEAQNRVITFKFPIQQNIPRGEDSGVDVPLLRLGETYLTYAEALNELGFTDEALPYVNALRGRAGLNPLQGLSQSEMREAILNERGWETYHEGYRREDLVRNGKLLQKVGEKYTFYFGDTMPWADNQSRRLMPIPSNALLLNPQLVQNDGYQ